MGGAAAAELEQRRRNAARQRLTPSAAKRVAEAGRAATDHAAVGAAFRSGDLDVEQVRLIAGLLRRVPSGQRAVLEQELVSLARGLDAVVFGRKARELVAQRAPEAATRTERYAESRRSMRATDTPEGGFAFSGLLHGTAAETARVALQAFRRPDTPDELRSPEERTADAFEQLCETALRAGEAPAEHGVRPHVVVLIEERDLGRPGGIARLAHSGQPLTPDAVGHLLDDCTVSRLVRDAAATPIEASVGVRTVPAGLWKALLARDAGCTWPGCDAPAAWCDVAHGNTAFRHGGRLGPANAALLCRRHHRRFDGGPYRMTITGGRVMYERITGDATLVERPHPLHVQPQPGQPQPGQPQHVQPQQPVRPASPTATAGSGPASSRPPAHSEPHRDDGAVTRQRPARPSLSSDHRGEPVSLFDHIPATGGCGPP
jgi:5-methylcytosine-specific restriction protein A